MFFRKVDLVLAQTNEYAQRFIALGCRSKRVIVTGSLKYDTAQIADTVEGADTLATRLNIVNERLWVAGATGDNEETIILDVYRSLKDEAGFDDLRLAIVPRKPERFGEVDEIIREKGFVPLRYSQIKDKATSGAEKSIINNKLSINTVILGDTMGDLRKFYSLASCYIRRPVFGSHGWLRHDGSRRFGQMHYLRSARLQLQTSRGCTFSGSRRHSRKQQR